MRTQTHNHQSLCVYLCGFLSIVNVENRSFGLSGQRESEWVAAFIDFIHMEVQCDEMHVEKKLQMLCFLCSLICLLGPIKQ